MGAAQRLRVCWGPKEMKTTKAASSSSLPNQQAHPSLTQARTKHCRKFSTEQTDLCTVWISSASKPRPRLADNRTARERALPAKGHLCKPLSHPQLTPVGSSRPEATGMREILGFLWIWIVGPLHEKRREPSCF